MSRRTSRARSNGARAMTDRRIFGRRHRFTTVLLWLTMPALVAVGLGVGVSQSTVAISAVVLAACGSAALLTREPFTASLLAAVGLLFGALAMAEFLDDPAGATASVLIATAAISIYRDWRLLVLSLGGSAWYLTQATGSWEAARGSLIAALVIGVVLAASWRLESGSDPTGRDAHRLRVAFEAAPVPMAMLKPSGEIVEVNSALVTMLGREDLRLRGSNIRSVIHTDDRTELGEAWEQMANGEEHRSATWARALADDGTALWCRLSLVLVPWDGNEPALIILQIEDMSHTHEPYRQLLDLSSEKDAYVATLLDEVSRPLDLVIDLTRSTTPDLDEIAANTSEAASIVDMLRQSARLAMGEVVMWSGKVEVAELCREASRSWGDRVQLDTPVGQVWADPTWVRQILGVLIGNAVKFGGPNVTVSTRRSGPDTVIAVSDDGAAFPVDERTRIFESDLANAEPVTEPVAVGLGLTVSRRLARHMDGDVTYRRAGDRNIVELRLPAEEVSPVDVA